MYEAPIKRKKYSCLLNITNFAQGNLEFRRLTHRLFGTNASSLKSSLPKNHRKNIQKNSQRPKTFHHIRPSSLINANKAPKKLYWWKTPAIKRKISDNDTQTNFLLFIRAILNHCEQSISFTLGFLSAFVEPFKAYFETFKWPSSLTFNCSWNILITNLAITWSGLVKTSLISASDFIQRGTISPNMSLDLKEPWKKKEEKLRIIPIFLSTKYPFYARFLRTFPRRRFDL